MDVKTGTRAQRGRTTLGSDSGSQGVEPVHSWWSVTVGPQAGANVFNASNESVVASDSLNSVGHDLGRRSLPRRNGPRHSSELGASAAASRLARTASGGASTAGGRATSRIASRDSDVSSAIDHLCVGEVIGSVRHNPKQARGVCCRRIRTAKKCLDGAWCLYMCGRSFGKCINEPVRPPIHSGELRAISFAGVAYGQVRLVRRHPQKLAAVDHVTEVPVRGMRNGIPNASQWPGMVRGLLGARQRSGNERLAISSNAWQERARRHYELERPGFRSSSRVTP